jgi:hypothetical protein
LAGLLRRSLFVDCGERRPGARVRRIAESAFPGCHAARLSPVKNQRKTLAMHHVRISPASHDEWCVGVGAGHYNNPLSKEDALREALRIAAAEKLTEIGVYDQEGKLLETVTLPPS